MLYHTWLNIPCFYIRWCAFRVTRVMNLLIIHCRIQTFSGVSKVPFYVKIGLSLKIRNFSLQQAEPFKRQLYKIVKHTQTTRRLSLCKNKDSA